MNDDKGDDDDRTPAERLRLLEQLEAIRAEIREQREMIEVLLSARGIKIPATTPEAVHPRELARVAIFDASGGEVAVLGFDGPRAMWWAECNGCEEPVILTHVEDLAVSVDDVVRHLAVESHG